MLIRREHTDNGGLLGIWHMEESKEELLSLLPTNMRIEAIEHIHTIRSEARTIEWLSTRLLLYRLLNEEKTILNKTDGKPYLKDESFHISISHTKNYAALYLHLNRPVGIDIETRSERVTRVAHKFIGENEYIDTTQKTIHLLLHWSAKESMFKLMEENEIDFNHHLHLRPFTPQLKGTISAKETKSELQRQFNIQYEVHSEYVLTWLNG